MVSPYLNRPLRSFEEAQAAAVAYRVQYLPHQPGEFGHWYADCWRPISPDRRYIHVETALRYMRLHAAALDAPAFRGVTRVVEVDDAGAIVRVVASLKDGTPKEHAT